MKVDTMKPKDKTKFDEWFNESEGFALRSERLEYELGFWVGRAVPAEHMQGVTSWMRAAYAQGCRDTAQDTLDTLGDYACATSGLDPEVLTPEQVYERAQQALAAYYDGL